MIGRMRPLTTIEDLDAAIARSASHPIVIFKHSGTCGTSAMAYEEIEAVLASACGGDIYLVDVRADRVVSQTIAARFNVRHESPQVLVIQDGIVRWQASHYRVTAEAVIAAVQSTRAAPAGSR